MSKIFLGIYSYDGITLPKTFSGPKDMVEESFKDYLEDNPDFYDGNKYIKISYGGLSATSHLRDPIAAAKECCSLLNNPIDNHKDDKEDVVESEDEIMEEDEEVHDPEDDFEKDDDSDEISNDRIIDDEIIPDDEWDGYEEEN